MTLSTQDNTKLVELDYFINPSCQGVRFQVFKDFLFDHLRMKHDEQVKEIK